MIFKDIKYYHIKEFTHKNGNTNDKRISNLCNFVNILSKYNYILFIELTPYMKTTYKSICSSSLNKTNLNYKQLSSNSDPIDTIEENRRNLDMMFIYIGRNDFDILDFENIYNTLYDSIPIYIISHINYNNKYVEINEDHISGIKHKDFEKIYKRSYTISGINDLLDD